MHATSYMVHVLHNNNTENISTFIHVYIHVYYCRMHELARPIIRESMDRVQFNPEAFTISEAAKHAKATPRIEELAQPITRGT